VAHESGVANTVDPLAGSYYVEALTSRIYNEAMDYIEKIEEMGGMVKAIEKGYIQKEIQDAAYRYQKDVEKGDRIVVGVNKFTVKEEAPRDLLKVDPALRDLQVKKLARTKAERDNEAVKKALKALEDAAAKPDVNLMPLIIDAVREYASLGEICNILREVYGEYKESIVL
jgi:methylmalonyl-CoA mutase N-terminal domain/subunit